MSLIHTNLDRVGFLMIFSRRFPWAVPISTTPLSAIVRHAWTSASVLISSIIITWGMWFSTASIMTWCCKDGSLTCSLLAPPIAGCGISPSPPISLLVSTITYHNIWRKWKSYIWSKWTMRKISSVYKGNKPLFCEAHLTRHEITLSWL